jgi:hypothetical protein
LIAILERVELLTSVLLAIGCSHAVRRQQLYGSRTAVVTAAAVGSASLHIIQHINRAGQKPSFSVLPGGSFAGAFFTSVARY